jgi:DsbC/DsbD-like thiol-disulfide interchange protein
MKPFGLLRLAVVSCGFCALLCFPSACKAQSEVNPDHFDGTDPWEAAAQKAHPVKPKPAQVRTALQSNPKKPGATVQLATKREFSSPAHHDVVAVEDKRKPAVQKPDKK